MSQPAITLNYFPVRGRGEVARLALYYSKKNFKDNRISQEDWPGVKPKAPFGIAPFIEIGNEAFGESMAIASYVAREADLYGASNIEALKVDQIMHTRDSLITEESKVWKEKDPAKKAEMTKNLNENIYPKYLGFFEKLIKENQAKTGSKYSVGKQLTLADIVLFEGTVTGLQNNPALLDKYPAVKGVAALVADLDGIKQYLAKRPKSDL